MAAPGPGRPASPAVKVGVRIGPNGEIIFIPEGQARKLSAGMEHAAVALPLDYMVQFDLTPHDALVTEWADIIHFTSTGNNCCDYGDRVPG